MVKTYEIVTFKLKPETLEEVYIAETKKLERNFLGKLHGFVDRQTGVSDDGVWTVVLHWETPGDAQSSIDKFVNSDETKAFTDLIDMDTFVMNRYALKDSYSL